jgi:hypothetical protein
VEEDEWPELVDSDRDYQPDEGNRGQNQADAGDNLKIRSRDGSGRVAWWSGMSGLSALTASGWLAAMPRYLRRHVCHFAILRKFEIPVKHFSVNGVEPVDC